MKLFVACASHYLSSSEGTQIQTTLTVAKDKLSDTHVPRAIFFTVA